LGSGLGPGAPALEHAARCMQPTESYRADMSDFDLADAHEALARAYAVAGNAEKAREHFDLAARAGEAVSDPENRAMFMADMKGGEWFGIEWPSSLPRPLRWSPVASRQRALFRAASAISDDVPQRGLPRRAKALQAAHTSRARESCGRATPARARLMQASPRPLRHDIRTEGPPAFEVIRRL